MNTHNVSKVPEYLELLKNQKQTIHDAQFRAGQRPGVIRTRGQVIVEFLMHQIRHAHISSHSHKDVQAIQSSFLPLPYTPCITPLGKLRKVMIKQLTLETHHRGTYMLLRAVTPTNTMTAVMVVVEDEEGNVVLLQLYNQEKELSVSEYLAGGRVMIVKEPYLKIMVDGNYGLRVDHLSDIMFLPKHDSLVPLSWRPRVMEEDAPADDWKVKGNDYFNKAGYLSAIECYSKALESSPTNEEALAIRLNRALTFLKTHRFDAALRDLEVALSISNLSEKALFRKAQALYHLQRFRESCEVHMVLGKEYPGNTAARGEFNRAIARLSEQKNTNYPFKQMYLDAKRRRPPHLDRATYIGPVSVKTTESRGRGLFTTDAVKAGDLLLCEKAFAYAFHDEKSPDQGISLLINAQAETMMIGTQAELIGIIVQKLYKNPSLISTFNDLHHGSYEPINVSEVDNIPVVDTFLTERIMSLNCFGFPLTSRESHIHIMMGQAQLLNASKDFHSCGVWPLASYINHSCYSNVRRSFIGDMMIVRATQDIAPNTELTFWYESPLRNEFKEERMALDHWGFKCSCIMCEDYEATGKTELAKRKKLDYDLTKAFKPPRKPNPAKIEDILSELGETYRKPASEVPRTLLCDRYLALASMYAVQNRPQKVIDVSLKALESMGYVVEGVNIPHTSGALLIVKKWGLLTDTLVGCWMRLSRAYRKMAPDLEAQAEKYARTTYKMCVGEDETFGETYSKHSDRMDGFLPAAK